MKIMGIKKIPGYLVSIFINLLKILLIISFIILVAILIPVNFQLFIIMLAGLSVFSLLCMLKIPSKYLFYLYIGALFYVDYIKLMFPFLPIKFIPDLMFIIFVGRVLIFDHKKIKGRVLRKESLIPNIILVIYLMFNFVEIFNPSLPNILIGLQSFRVIYKILGIFWGGLVILNTKEEIGKFLKFIRINIFIIFLFSFKQIIFGFSNYELTVPQPGNVRRVYSFLANGAVFSLIMGIGSLDFYLKAIYENKARYLFLVLCYLFVSALSLYRAPLLATFVALGVISLVNGDKLLNFIMNKFNKILLLIFIIFLSSFLLFQINMPSRLVSLRNELTSRFMALNVGIENENSIRTRLDQIPAAVVAARRYPFGGGLGYTNLRYGHRADYASVFSGLYASNYSVRLPMGTGDSTFLTVLLETGIFGLIFFVALILMAIINCAFKSLISINNEFQKYLTTYSLGVLILILITIITSSIYFSLIVGTMFWLFFSLSQNIFLNEKRKS